jgi:uncharacterized protein YdaU (DUF1376 family)
MAQHPIMPLATDALIGDTTHLSAEEFGAYLLILIATWRNNGCPLPDDDVRLSRICRCGWNRWATKIRPRLIEFFDISDGYWHQKRLENTWCFVKNRREKQSAKGKRSAELRALKTKETASTVVVTERQPPNPLRSKKDSDSASAESAAVDAAASPINPIKVMFDRGVALLRRAGVPEKQARAMIGKWRGEFGDAAVLSATEATENEPSVSEPVSFFVGCLNQAKRGRRSNGHAKQSPGEKLFEGAARAALAWGERERARFQADEPLLDIGRSDTDAPSSD